MSHLISNRDGTLTIGIKEILELYEENCSRDNYRASHSNSRFICDVVKNHLMSYGVPLFNFRAFSNNFQDEWIRVFNPKLKQHLEDTISRIPNCAPWDEPKIFNDMMYWNCGGYLHYIYDQMGIPVTEIRCAKITLQRGDGASKLIEMQYRLRVLSDAADLHPDFSVTF